MMLATGVPERTLLTGRMASVDGAAPKLHIIVAPVHAKSPMGIPLLLRARAGKNVAEA